MAQASLEGQTVGKYRILEPLGSGGMARVYRAYHPQLDRYVAVKVLRSDLVDDESFLTRFRREAQAVAGLRHPNIIQVHDFEIENDIYFMVMELLDGDTLHTRLNDYRVRDEQMPWGEMARIMLDVLAGLAYAHEEGMVHRDIKPANILLTRRGQAVLADFGIAQMVGETRHTMTGALLGTLNYMSPEQGLEGKSDGRSDIYSLGVVFYEMLTRQPPYQADTPLAVLLKHVNDPLPLPRSANDAIPESFERIVLKALSKQPENRYPSALAMMEAVQNAVIEAGIELPVQISLPMSFSTPAAPSESVAVFSGEARAGLRDAEFAAEDTAATRFDAWEAELDALKAQESPSTPSDSDKPARGQFVRSLANGLGLLIGGNLALVMISGRSGPGSFFVRGWPIELFLAAAGLFHIMTAMRNFWLFIPSGLLLGEAVLMTYYSLSDNWDDWSFLWPLQVIIVLVVVLVTINQAANRERASELSVSLGQRFLQMALVSAGLLFLAVWLF